MCSGRIYANAVFQRKAGAIEVKCSKIKQGEVFEVQASNWKSTARRFQGQATQPHMA